MRSGHFDIQFWLPHASYTNSLWYVAGRLFTPLFSSASFFHQFMSLSFPIFIFVGYNPGYGHFSHLNNRYGCGTTQNQPYYYSNYAQPFSAYTLNRHQQPLANGYLGPCNQSQVHILNIHPSILTKRVPDSFSFTIHFYFS